MPLESYKGFKYGKKYYVTSQIIVWCMCVSTQATRGLQIAPLSQVAWHTGNSLDGMRQNNLGKDSCFKSFNM